MTWRSKKQPVVFRNSAESKFKALALGICEGMWKQKLLRELGVELVNIAILIVYVDDIILIGDYEELVRL